MVYKLKPLEFSFDFEDREYSLGETVDVQVTLEPNGDVHVREARVDLVCEQVLTRNERGIVIGMGGAQSIQGGNTFTSTDYVPSSSSVSERLESYVHSDVTFLKDADLTSGRLSTQDLRLQIKPDPPERMEEALESERDANSAWSFKWRLVVSVDIVRGRNPKRQRGIKVKLPQPTASQPTGARARLSRPKKSTVPSS